VAFFVDLCVVDLCFVGLCFKVVDGVEGASDIVEEVVVVDAESE